MTIEELISEESVLRKNAPSFMKTPVECAIQAVCSDMNIQLKYIATDYVFPRVFKINGEYSIIWDQTYWQLYFDFLVALADFNTELSEDNSIFYENSDKGKIQYVFSNYLALAVKNPAVATNFAVFYHSGQLNAQINRLGMSIADFRDYVEIAQLFTAIHEQYHIVFKRDDLRKREELYATANNLRTIATIIENMSDVFIKDEFLMSKNDLLQIVFAASQDNDLQIDILCDTYAFNTCLSVFRECWKSKCSDIEIVTRCLEGIRILGYFNSSLLGLRMFWQECKCDIDSVKSFQKANTHRTYLSEFMSMLQLQAQGIGGYEDKHLWKFGSFEENYKLESLVYSHFFSDDAVKEWIQPRTIKKCKFELLNWRV